MSQSTGSCQTHPRYHPLSLSSTPSEHSYIAVAIINGKMLTISIHMSLPPSAPNTPDNHSVISTETPIDDLNFHAIHIPELSLERDMPLAPLQTARCCFGLASFNDKIYAVGKCTAPMRCVNENIAWLAGGYNRGDCLDSIEQYDPKQDAWNLVPCPLNYRRGRVSATIIQNTIYVCGGSDGQRELNSVECFDLTSTNPWSTIRELPTPVAHAGRESAFTAIDETNGLRLNFSHVQRWKLPVLDRRHRR